MDAASHAAEEPPSIDPSILGMREAFAAAKESPIVECARRKALAIQAGLDELAANVEGAMAQLDDNRITALAVLQKGATARVEPAEVLAIIATGVETVLAAAASKRAGLEKELVVADAALSEAIDAVAAAVEASDAEEWLLQVQVHANCRATQASETLDDTTLARRASGLSERMAEAEAMVAGIPSRPSTSTVLSVRPAPHPKALRAALPRLLGALASITLVEPPRPPPVGPAGFTAEHATQLQNWLPASGLGSPVEWEEVYRATTHGFGAAAFHARCDRRARLLVLIRSLEDGWLFGGFTAVGFTPPTRWIADPAAFLFSLTNSLGRPEKLESNRTGKDLYFHPLNAAIFGDGWDLGICDNANTSAYSCTNTGFSFAASASTGTHPMAQGPQSSWHAAEIVAWVV